MELHPTTSEMGHSSSAVQASLFVSFALLRLLFCHHVQSSPSWGRGFALLGLRLGLSFIISIQVSRRSSNTKYETKPSDRVMLFLEAPTVSKPLHKYGDGSRVESRAQQIALRLGSSPPGPTVPVMLKEGDASPKSLRRICLPPRTTVARGV